MKRIAILFSILLISSPAFAGEYDGVWSSHDFGGNIYFVIIEKSGSLIFFQLDAELNECDPNFGTISGNVATVQTLAMPGEDHFLEAQITFTSESTATGVFLSCTGECSVTPPGVSWNMVKVY